MSNTYIPADVRRELWISSGGRCEFRGCNENINRNFLTGQKVVLGQFCHIVGDSVNGPRGDPERSKALAQDPDNLILCCARCHKTIDDGMHASEYPEAVLQSMKRDHELHVQRLYDATNVKRSVPFIVTGRVNKTPTSIPTNLVRAAVLKKTDYMRFPSYDEEVLDLNKIPFSESDSRYWEAVKHHIDDTMGSFLRRVNDRNIHHLDLFSLAQIPALAYIGALIGDRVPVSVHQPQREPLDRWSWSDSPTEAPDFSYVIPDQLSSDELAISFSMSGVVKGEDINRALPRISLEIGRAHV